jgi:hypothetical protein
MIAQTKAALLEQLPGFLHQFTMKLQRNTIRDDTFLFNGTRTPSGKGATS